MKEKIKMILCLCLIIAGLPILTLFSRLPSAPQTVFSFSCHVRFVTVTVLEAEAVLLIVPVVAVTL